MRTYRRSVMARLIVLLTVFGLALALAPMPSSTASAASTSLSGDEASFNSRTATKAAAKGTKVKGNNGVGNGLDPAPPGNPPENDGPGTSPGNPGRKGPKP